MHRDRLISTTFALLSILAAVAFAATTKKPSTESTIKANNISSVQLDSRQRIILHLGADGNPDKQCECTIFHLCNQGDIINEAVGINGETCDNGNFCCANPRQLVYSTEDEVTAFPPLIPNNWKSTNNNVQPTASKNVSSQFCECVSSSQCLPFVQANYVDGILKPRNPCVPPKICCPLDHIIPTVSPDSSTIPPTKTPPTATTSVQPNVDQCGIRKALRIDPRITVMEDSMYQSFGEFPWMALLLTTKIAPNGTRTENFFVCGASVLAPNIILTAAHCVKGIDINLLKVRVGEYNTQSISEPFPHQERRVSAIRVHEKFNSQALYNDLALLVLGEDIGLTSHISTICAPLVGSPYAQPNSYNPDRCVATGWGKNAFGVGDYQMILRKVDLPIVPRDECERQLRQTRLGPNFQLDSSFICAIGQGGADTCEGDGGGPLVCESTTNPGRYIQVGVTSWGIGCGNDIPAVYASLEANNQWLSTEFNSTSTFLVT